uniref:Uncharacterized protein n=1 Tax=Favella ehrenbergii TaxID=182087 RepID=A0A7S3HXL1_9SPIT|mmetsp:Transcript_16044/g.20320  ORF Transcript_16044/g.20320 Transcript_16044/m.20320 type:complete len:111 (+) Transcript_16044:315-647(+)
MHPLPDSTIICHGSVRFFAIVNGAAIKLSAIGTELYHFFCAQVEDVFYGVTMTGVETAVHAPPPCVPHCQIHVLALLHHLGHVSGRLPVNLRYAGSPVEVCKELFPLFDL